MEKQYYISKEQYETMKETWAATRDHSAAAIIIYNILRSKPADRGFSVKTRNIQSNDPWNGFNSALRVARSWTSKSNPWSKYSDPKDHSHASYLRGEERIKKNYAWFEEVFSIKAPDDIDTKLAEVEFKK